MASGGHNKFTIERVRSMFEEQGWRLLSDMYVNNNTKMKAVCPCGEEVEARLADVLRGRRCQKCKGKTNSAKFKTPDNELAAFCQQHGHQFVRAWIEKRKTRIEYVCKCGTQAKAYWTNFKKFPNCKKCGAAKISGDKCHMYDPDREAVAMRKRFRKMCGQHIHRFMKATGQKKTKSTHLLLGYKPQDLQDHILNHPDMAALKDKEWHVDHIWPIQAFIDHGILDLQKINALSNLRPMAGPENLSKADKYDTKEFELWLASKQ